MKKILLTLSPIAIVVLIIFAATTYGRANESSVDSFEKYYTEDEFRSEIDEYVTIESDSILTKPNQNLAESVTGDSFLSTLITGTPSSVDIDANSITVLVNKSYTLEKDYEPEDLVVPNIKFSFTQYDPKMLLRQEAATAMENLFHAALEEGLQLAGVSGYRSYKRQFEIYATNLIRRGVTFTNQYSAMAGTSEHQTGLAMDISTSSINYRLSDEFASTPEGQWVAQHCHEYGFIIRYPKDKTEITGYAYEPWHIRYVGVELATYLTMHDLTLDEYYGYAYEDQPLANIDYNAIVQEYYAMKGIDPNSQTEAPTQSPEEITDFESLEDDLILDEETDSEEESTENEEGTDSTTPTAKPTKKPAKDPTETPTEAPTTTPTESPTKDPSEKPSQKPTVAPEELLPEATPTPDVTPPTTTPEPTQPPAVTPTPEEGSLDSSTPSPTSAIEGEMIQTNDGIEAEDFFQEY